MKVNDKKEAILTLSSLTGIAPEVIRDCLGNFQYRKVKIPKDKEVKIPKGEEGEFRELQIPDERLMALQKVILESLLYRLPVSEVAFCSIPRRSIAGHISLHCQSKSFFKIDFKDAFPSVSRKMIIQHLTPMIEKHSFYPSLPRKEIEELVILLSSLTIYEDALPQGAPASPYLLNLVCYELDLKILEIARKFNLLYSRYADDLMISTPKSKIPKEARVAIVNLVKKCGFKINRKKTTYKTGTATVPKITGVTLISADNLGVKSSLPRKQIEEYRRIIYTATRDPNVELGKVFGIMGWVEIATGGEIPSRLKKPFKEFLERRYPKGLPRYIHLL